MKIKETVGIDVGKMKNEVRIHTNQKYKNFDNTVTGITSMIKWTLASSNYAKEQILFAFEHTGIYSQQISVYLTENGFNYVMLPGLEIRRSMGITRGKDDKIDAKKIALYTYRRKDELKPYELPSKNIKEIKSLLNLREKLVKQRSGYKATLCEYKRFLKRKENTTLFSVHEKMINELTKQINKIENNLMDIVDNDENLKELYKLLTSIKGIGQKTALFMIAYTGGFTRFETWRKFASYCGIAPFPNTSGISIRGKTKVNNLANKKIKSLLDLCAKSSIQWNSEMKLYYERRIADGKSKMGTINIVRNKLLSRMFAVVRRGTPYVDTLAYCA